MRLRRFLGLLIPLACALLFIRLGFWQVSRHYERARFNAALASRLASAPLDLASVLPSPDSLEWRQVRLAGRFRYDLEQVHAGRTNAGSPGVHLITPLEREGNDTLVPVVRGWVYSPDAAKADLPRWREQEAVTITGYLLPLAASNATALDDPARPLRWLDQRTLGARFGRPVAPLQVVMVSDSAPRLDSVPRRLALPVADGGPHFSYALQWFAFATIALVGGVLLYRRSAPAGA